MLSHLWKWFSWFFSYVCDRHLRKKEPDMSLFKVFEFVIWLLPSLVFNMQGNAGLWHSLGESQGTQPSHTAAMPWICITLSLRWARIKVLPLQGWHLLVLQLWQPKHFVQGCKHVYFWHGGLCRLTYFCKKPQLAIQGITVFDIWALLWFFRIVDCCLILLKIDCSVQKWVYLTAKPHMWKATDHS